MKVFAAGVNYRTAPVKLREQLAIWPGGHLCRACQLRATGNLQEVVLLSTCNRVEVYCSAPHACEDPLRLFQLLSSTPTDLGAHLYVHRDVEAAEHLFRVTAGLDSMVFGETEITGQVKQAYEQARLGGFTGRVLNQLFQKALETAKEIRASTGVGRGATSVGSAAVEVAEKIFGASLSTGTVLIIGAGQMGEACIRHFSKRGARSVVVSNRSLDRGQTLAAEFGGRAVPFEDYLRAIQESDIVITCTGCPHVLLGRAELEALLPARRRQPLFLVDISVPRNINPDVQLLDNVYLYDIDDLQGIARQNVCQRQQALAACEPIIHRALQTLWPRLLSSGSESGRRARVSNRRPSANPTGHLFHPAPALIPG